MFLVLQGLIKYPGPISDKMSPEVTFTTPDGESYEINQSVDYEFESCEAADAVV